MIRKGKTFTLVEPAETARDTLAAIQRARRLLEGELAAEKVRTSAGRSYAARRERRLQATGEAAFESPWHDPENGREALSEDDAFTITSSDRATRVLRSHRRRRLVRAAYWTTLGPPPDCAPGDRVAAMIFYRRIRACIEQGGWSHNEQTALAALEKTWGRRARGEDARFIIAGNKVGRLPRAVERRVKSAGKSE